MKRIGLLVITALFCLVQTQAQTKKDKPEMAFGKTVDGITFHDFGSIVYGASGKVDFTFTNNGKTPLTISDVKSSCGCAVPTYSKEPVAPGKQGTVTVEYNTKLPGLFNKTVAVYSNANNSPVRIEVRGKVNTQLSDLKPGTVNNGPQAILQENNGTSVDTVDPFAAKKAKQKANIEARQAVAPKAGTPAKQPVKAATKK